MTNFFDRYSAQVEKSGLDPCSQKAADMFDVTRSTISAWNTKDITPKGDTVARIADKLGVSTDYLLGRTDDPRDYTKETPADDAGGEKVVMFEPGIMKLYRKLDAKDRLKAEGVIQGMLMQDKYTDQLNAAHSGESATPDDEAHDDGIMGDPDF